MKTLNNYLIKKNKKIIKKIFLGLTVLASSLSFAQQFGVKAGLNLSDISNTSTAVDTKMKTGLYAGVTATFPITESYSIKPELAYNQMGAKTDLYDFGGIIGQVSTTTKLDYLSLPIMLQYNLPSNLYLEVGPEFSYMLSANQSLNTIITPSTNINMDYLNRFNVGAGVGAGLKINENLGINARYTFGLTGIGKDGNVTDYFLSNSKNNNLQVGLDFNF